jgi:class 3 adenylate cyclase
MAGEVQILPVPGRRPLEEAVDLNRDGARVISTFGKRRFAALIGFIDMRGFSERARGKPPAEVRDLAAPFVAATVDVARRHRCFIDKTIGDEVMVVMPSFGRDVGLSSLNLRVRNPLLLEMGELIVDLIEAMSACLPGVGFAAGFSMGDVVLDRVGSQDYGEWTVYGNSVNAAMRLQSMPIRDSALSECKERHWLVTGAIEADEPEWKGELKAWVGVVPSVGRLRLVNPVLESNEFKGVGLMCYVATEVLRKGMV